MLYLPTEVSLVETVRYALGTQPPRPLPDALTVPAQSAIEELLSSCLPQYHYRLLSVQELPNILLSGQDIRRHLSGCERCILLAATLGAQADRLIRRAQITDMNRALWLDAAASATIEAVCDAAQSAISAQLHCGLTSRFSCGYGDFPLAAQGAILELLDTPRKIGLTLGESGMMIPLKSVTALMGVLPDGTSSDGQPSLCTRCQLYQNGCDGTRCRNSMNKGEQERE